MDASIHLDMDSTPASKTVFLHEDVIAHTLMFEQELKAWRLKEMQEGRCDPGRPSYEDIFAVRVDFAAQLEPFGFISPHL